MNKKSLLVGALAGFGAAAWSAHRNKKYPLAKGYALLNKFSVPGAFVCAPVSALGNAVLQKMPLPTVPAGLKRRCLQFTAHDGVLLSITVYEPEKSSCPLPCLVYLHGGGFCFGDAWYIHQNVCDYALAANCRVAFVHYRTSDSSAFPVPFQDCCSALQYIWQHCSALGIDRSRIAIGGDSAGGALAAACTLWARDEAKIPLCFQLLVYPVTDCRMQTASMRAFTDSPLWNARLNRRMWQLYLRDGDCGMPAYASPMLADDFSSLPPAYVEVEQFDCLRDEGIAYAQALQDAGVAVELKIVKNTFHGFDVLRSTPITRQMLHRRGEALRSAFWDETK